MGEHRVVVLARDGKLIPPDPRTLGLNVVFVRAEGGYEAAAELLSRPAMALLIDLPHLTLPHRKLLHVARQLGVEVLGVGAFPTGLSAGDLSGMRLISTDDLPSELRNLLQRAESAPPAATAPKPDVRLTPIRKTEYKSSPQEQSRQSRIISPASRRDANHHTGRIDH
jgi:hypothetical protein